MNSIAIVYWNGNEKTETIGRMIARGAADSGVLVTIFTAEEFKPSRMASFNAVAFGCPTVDDEESYSFDAYLDELGEHLHEAPVAVFGSYEDAGDAVDAWEESMVSRGVELVSAIKLDNFPQGAQVERCMALGAKLGSFAKSEELDSYEEAQMALA